MNDEGPDCVERFALAGWLRFPVLRVPECASTRVDSLTHRSSEHGPKIKHPAQQHAHVRVNLLTPPAINSARIQNLRHQKMLPVRFRSILQRLLPRQGRAGFIRAKHVLNRDSPTVNGTLSLRESQILKDLRWFIRVVSSVCLCVSALLNSLSDIRTSHVPPRQKYSSRIRINRQKFPVMPRHVRELEVMSTVSNMTVHKSLVVIRPV